MRERLASWLRGLADWLDAEDEPTRNDPAMFLRTEVPELRSPVAQSVGTLDTPAFVEPHDFDEYEFWPKVRSGGGMYL